MPEVSQGCVQQRHKNLPAVRESNVTPRITLKYLPEEHQAKFHRSPAKYRALFGGYGNGKTMAFCAEAISLSLEYPMNFGLVGRMTYPELRDSTWHELLNFPVMVDDKNVPLVASPLIKTYNKAEHSLEFCNGSLVVGRALEASFDKVKSMNLGFFGIDQLEEVPESMWLGLIGRLRRKNVRHTAFGVGNPEGHDWIWKRWVMNADNEHFIVNAPSSANSHLPEGYVQGLIDQYPDEWVKRYVYGSFDTFEGLVYKEFQDKEPYVVTPSPIPEHWYRFVSIDHGYRNPTAVLWGAVGDDGQIIIYDEFYETNHLVSEIATVLEAKAKENKPKLYLIDPSCRNRNGVTGKSVIDEFSANKIYCQPANNDVRAGINRIQELLKLQGGKPKIRIFSNCTNLRTELQTYRWKDLKPSATTDAPEKPQKKEDHAVDALRYMVMYLYQTPQKRAKRGFDYKDILKRRKESVEVNWRAA